MQKPETVLGGRSPAFQRVEKVGKPTFSRKQFRSTRGHPKL